MVLCSISGRDVLLGGGVGARRWDGVLVDIHWINLILTPDVIDKSTFEKFMKLCAGFGVGQG